MVENAFYVCGHDDGVLSTPAGRIGVALCWEMIRSRTVRRLAGRVDYVLAASFWWGHCLPYESAIADVQLRSEQLLREAPRELARLLGDYAAASLSRPDVLSRRRFLGHSQIVGCDGAPVAVLESEAGVLVSELPAARLSRDAAATPSRYWIPDLPDKHLRRWEEDAVLGKEYYRTVALPRYRDLNRGFHTKGSGQARS